MSTIFTNLIENACKYTPENGTVTVRMESEQEALRLEVINTTPRSLSEEQLERIFDPFYRIEGSSPKGTGLGLAIAKKLIERQGGAIKASQSPEGFRVSLVLPSMQNQDK